MTNQSPHPKSQSPSGKQPMSAFQWPPSLSSSSTEISLKEILERHGNEPELLKCILAAKSEEDKKKAARDTLKAEEARIQLRHMDLELAREQSKPRGSHVQQVVSRFNYPTQSTHHLPPPQQQQSSRPPSSPAIAYPHSAHPLCPPSNDYRLHYEERSLKRHRASISSETDQDRLSHNKVMEALKAKIQRSHNSTSKDTKKRKHSRPVIKVSSDSPKSVKPILPPIDTNLGRGPSDDIPQSRSSTPEA